jgi:hypothetical protein
VGLTALEAAPEALGAARIDRWAAASGEHFAAEDFGPISDDFSPAQPIVGALHHRKELPMAATDTPSDTVLDETPARALKFLGAISTNRAIRAVLAKRTYTQDTHELGWQLLLKAMGYRKPAQDVRDSPEAANAIAAIDSWDEPNFRVARASLAGDFPDQCAFIFQDLEAQTGVAAVVSVTTFLDRLDELETGKERKATHKADQAALAKLADRGITAAERARLRGLLKIAQGPSAQTPADTAGSPDPKQETTDQRAAKIALRKWYVEWSEIAKADIKRRDHLIQLGLAKRKPRAKKGPPGTGEGSGS